MFSLAQAKLEDDRRRSGHRPFRPTRPLYTAGWFFDGPPASAHPHPNPSSDVHDARQPTCLFEQRALEASRSDWRAGRSGPARTIAIWMELVFQKHPRPPPAPTGRCGRPIGTAKPPVGGWWRWCTLFGLVEIGSRPDPRRPFGVACQHSNTRALFPLDACAPGEGEHVGMQCCFLWVVWLRMQKFLGFSGLGCIILQLRLSSLPGIKPTRRELSR
jgi:hypothetical protein